MLSSSYQPQIVLIIIVCMCVCGSDLRIMLFPEPYLGVCCIYGKSQRSFRLPIVATSHKILALCKLLIHLPKMRIRAMIHVPCHYLLVIHTCAVCL